MAAHRASRGAARAARARLSRAAAGLALVAAIAAPLCADGAARAADAGRLPEDPVASKQAAAQWRQHMADEERERRLGYDRRRMKEHAVVFGFIRKTRQRYDRARTRRAIARLQAQLAEPLADVRRRAAAIDHWGVSSNVLADYDAMLAALAGPYPAALLAALDGEQHTLAELRADLDARTRKVRDWLAEAARSEDE